jgi:peptidyl-tRNA hydrolase, PTH1 family
LRVVVGLGNPGKKYELTRHNIGFLILDSFAVKHNLNFLPSKFDFYYSEGRSGSSDFFLIKPVTYMNMSGVALSDFLAYHEAPVEEILVVADDVNLPEGRIRLRKSGSDGGHNGIKSIIYQISSDSFPRLRFGIGSRFEKGEMSGFVLSRFEKEEFGSVRKKIEFAVELIEEFIEGGYGTMLDYFSLHSPKFNKKEDSIDPGEDSPAGHHI